MHEYPHEGRRDCFLRGGKRAAPPKVCPIGKRAGLVTSAERSVTVIWAAMPVWCAVRYAIYYIILHILPVFKPVFFIFRLYL